MPALSKKVKLLHREFWEIKISKRDQSNPKKSKRSWNLLRSHSCKPPRVPGSVQGMALTQGKE